MTETTSLLKNLAIGLLILNGYGTVCAVSALASDSQSLYQKINLPQTKRQFVGPTGHSFSSWSEKIDSHYLKKQIGAFHINPHWESSYLDEIDQIEECSQRRMLTRSALRRTRFPAAQANVVGVSIAESSHKFMPIPSLSLSDFLNGKSDTYAGYDSF